MILNTIIIQWILLGLLFWVLILTGFLIQSIFHYRRLTKNIKKKDLKTVLSQILNQVELNKKNIKKLELELETARKNMQTHIQKIGFVRFNPFSQTGGDQSFSLALLDEKNNGFVISSLHSRDITRLYAKTIIKGEAQQLKLSKEEKKAIKNAN